MESKFVGAVFKWTLLLPSLPKVVVQKFRVWGFGLGLRSSYLGLGLGSLTCPLLLPSLPKVVVRGTSGRTHDLPRRCAGSRCTRKNTFAAR